MFSKACKYGIRAVLFLVVNGDENSRISPETIAETLEVPRHFLAKILQQLSKNGLVSSVKGPGGGFFLSPENRQQHVSEIIYAIDGRDVLNACVLGLERCSSKSPCPLHFQAFSYREGLRLQLENQTIDGLGRGLNSNQLKNIEL